ncbi:hypothetical protein V6B16_06190 [Salinimicrobium catena]|uniref:hypothetical protein n=1 Tax=Salinimicrobium catena TaxID=390640 RepID=UPI002FE47E5F
MRKLFFLPLIFVLNLFLLGCEKDEELIQTSFMNVQWIESFEEKTSEEIEVYRTGNVDDFPPSWYRQIFYFDNNNEVEYSVLAANDAHYMTSGTWEYDEETKIIKIYNSDSEKVFEFKIVEQTDQVLKLIANP